MAMAGLPVVPWPPFGRVPSALGTVVAVTIGHHAVDLPGGVFDRRALLLAAAVSVATTVLLFGFLALAGFATIAVAGVLAATHRPVPAARTLSVGCGLLAGPVAYLVLAVVVRLAG